MTPALAQDGQRLAHELYGLLRALDRTPAESERPKLKERTELLAEQLRATLEKGTTPAPPAVRRRLAEMAKYVEELRHKLSQGASEPSVFSSFRVRAAPAYEALAASLRAAHVPAPTLRPTNHARSLMHMTSGFIGVAAVELLPWPFVIGIATAFFLFAWTMEFGRRRSEAWHRFAMVLFGKVAHPHEAVRVNSATWYATALIILSLSFSPHACALACVVLGIADPAAAYVGRRFGRHRLRAGRSLEGTLAFVAAGTLAALGILAIFHGSFGLALMLPIALVAGIVGALAELLSGTVDDNLSIPLAVGAGVLVASHVLGIA